MALSSPPPQSDPSLFSSSPTPPLSHCYYQSPQKTLHRKLLIINYNISQSKNQNKNPSSIQRSAQPTPKSAPLRQPKPRRVLPKLFLSFLLWRTEREQRTEKRGRAEEKKIEERENIRQNERQRKKEKKSLNRRVRNSFLIDEATVAK